MNKFGFGIAVLLFASVAPMASATTITSSGSGWCSDVAGCDNSDTTQLANNFAGSPADSLTGVYQDWFAFTLPSTQITSASISIYNDGQNFTNDPSVVYSLYAASSINYGGLATGPLLGSVTVSSWDTGTEHTTGANQWVTIALNSTADLAILNANLGDTFIFGGSSETDPALASQIFGHTDGNPAAYLTVTTTTPETPSVPEPNTFLLIGSGLLGVVGTLRRKIRG